VVKRCTILRQSVPDDAPPDERDVLRAADAVHRGLRADGWTVALHSMSLDLAAAEAALRRDAPDLVFNLVESLGGADVLAVAAPALLERLALPYTGNGLAAIALTADKRATRRALRRAGVPVPPGLEDGWRGPFIVKHATAHASLGLGRHSVVRDPPTPDAGWYAEAFIDGREFNVSLLADHADGVEALPVAELLFQDWPADMPRILDYAGKWDPDHPHYARTVRSFTVEPALARRLQAMAVACWQALGLAGYARVDLRMDDNGVAYAIDVNANPCLSEDAGFAAAAAQAGLDHAGMVARVAFGNEARLSPSPCGRGAGGGGGPHGHRSRPPPPSPPARGGGKDPTTFALRRNLRPDDDIAALCAATGFFTPDEIAIAEELAADRRTRGAASDYRFVLADAQGGLAGYACYGPTPGTREAWDLYWIVMHPRAQGSGGGRALLESVLADMAAGGGRRLYAETSSKPQYAPTRAFYAAAGFTLQAVVPDFYASGDGKQIWLRLASR
jgi:D-alanine-D-alanine ligase